MKPVATAQDRSMSVPPGHRVATGYVEVHRVRLACRDRMAVGDVSASYQRLLQMGGEQPWPCPNGAWEDDTFVIHDGRHQYVASLMLGYEYILVAWIEEIK